MWNDGTVVAWAHYLGGRQGYPRRLNGVKLTIDDVGIYLDGPYRTRFLIPWNEVYEIAVEPNPDIEKPETTYVTRLVKKTKGASSIPVSKPATAYFRIDTAYNESVVFAIAGVSLSQFRDGLSPWVDWPVAADEPSL